MQGNGMIEFNVEGMTCQHCVAAVTRSIHEVDADAKVTIDLPSGSVCVDSEKSAVPFEQAIDDAGYVVLSMKNV